MKYSKYWLLVIWLFFSFLLTTQIETIHVSASSTNSPFQISQKPSGGQIPSGTEISIQLKPAPGISNEVDNVLLFYCLISSNSSCGTYPTNMTKNATSAFFYSSVTPNCPDAQLRYRFVIYYTNGTPACFPSWIEFELDSSVIQGETGLYYFAIEISENQESIKRRADFAFIAPLFSLAALVVFRSRWKK